MPLPTLASLSLRSVAPTAVKNRVVVDSDEDSEEEERQRERQRFLQRRPGVPYVPYQTWVVPARTPSPMSDGSEEEQDSEEEEEAPCEERLRAAVAHIDHLEQELAEERERLARMERRVYGESSSGV